MKFTTANELKDMLIEQFKDKIEGVNRSRRAGNPEGDYDDEDEGPGVSYDESVDRANRGEELSGEYHDELDGDGQGVTYETNLYSDSQSSSPNFDAEQSEDDVAYEDEDPNRPKPSSHKGKFPHPPGMGEGRLPSLKSVFGEGKSLGVGSKKKSKKKKR